MVKGVCGSFVFEVEGVMRYESPLFYEAPSDAFLAVIFLGLPPPMVVGSLVSVICFWFWLGEAMVVINGSLRGWLL